MVPFTTKAMNNYSDTDTQRHELQLDSAWGVWGGGQRRYCKLGAMSVWLRTSSGPSSPQRMNDIDLSFIQTVRVCESLAYCCFGLWEYFISQFCCFRLWECVWQESFWRRTGAGRLGLILQGMWPLPLPGWDWGGHAGRHQRYVYVSLFAGQYTSHTFTLTTVCHFTCQYWPAEWTTLLMIASHRKVLTRIFVESSLVSSQ